MGATELALFALKTFAAASRGDVTRPMTVQARPGGGGGLGGDGFASGVRAWQTNEIVAAGINLLCNSAAEPPIVGYRRRVPKKTARTVRQAFLDNGIPHRNLARELVRNGVQEELPDHPLVKLLNNPQPVAGGLSRGKLWGMVVMDRKLAGKAYLLKGRNQGFGNVEALWRLRPDRVTPIYGSDGIAGYEYALDQRTKTVYPARDVIAFPERNPMNEMDGYPPLAAVMGRISIDEYMKGFLRDFFEKGGTGPGSILNVKGQMLDEDKQEIRERFRRQFGPGGYHEMLILDNSEGATWEQLGLDRGLRDALPKELNDVIESRIAMVLGIPGSIIGLLIGYESSSYANKRQDWQVLWDITMSPLMSDLDDVLNLAFLSENDPEFSGIDEVQFDLSNVRALQEDQDALQNRAKSHYQAGGMAFEEYRMRIGLDPTPSEGHFLVPAGQTLVSIGQALEPKEEWTPAADVLLKVLAEVTAGQLSPEAAKIMLKVSFPSMDPAQVDEMVDASARFEPESPPPMPGTGPSGPDSGAPAPANVVGVSFGDVGREIRDAVREVQAGRPRTEDDPQARAVFEQARALKERFPRMTQEQLAGRLNVSERTLRRYNEVFGA